VLIIKICAR
jgi:hypothetical protein